MGVVGYNPAYLFDPFVFIRAIRGKILINSLSLVNNFFFFFLTNGKLGLTITDRE
jgi:hypothetical protein